MFHDIHYGKERAYTDPQKVSKPNKPTESYFESENSNSSKANISERKSGDESGEGSLCKL